MAPRRSAVGRTSRWWRTVLDRLVRKGKLARRKVGRAFVYRPETPRDELRKVAIRELVDGFFDGSEEKLILFLRGEEQVAAAGADESRIDTVLL